MEWHELLLHWCIWWNLRFWWIITRRFFMATMRWAIQFFSRRVAMNSQFFISKNGATTLRQVNLCIHRAAHQPIGIVIFAVAFQCVDPSRLANFNCNISVSRLKIKFHERLRRRPCILNFRAKNWNTMNGVRRTCFLNFHYKMIKLREHRPRIQFSVSVFCEIQVSMSSVCSCEWIDR